MNLIGKPPSPLSNSLRLPCGLVLPNRIAKSATSEALADSNNNATEKLVRLYKLWSEGGAGLLITGNVMVDRRHMEGPGNVAIDDNVGMSQLKAWSSAASSCGNQVWIQLSHAGRQASPDICPKPVSASDVQLRLPMRVFARPRPLTEEEIIEIIERFARAALTAKNAGFSGIQLHAAHGYLISQFLSPRINLRTDKWGGSIENRARLLLEIIRAIRKLAGSTLALSIKINTTDFICGGFSHSDCLAVVKMMNEEGLDLLELSGGTYESMVMLSSHTSDSLDKNFDSSSPGLAKEVFFLKYASDVKQLARMPIMLTGGFRSKTVMEECLAKKLVDVIGLARPFCLEPDFPKVLLSGQLDQLSSLEEQLQLGFGWLGQTSPWKSIRVINTVGGAAWFTLQLQRLAEGIGPNLKMSIAEAIIKYLSQARLAAKHLNRTVKEQTDT